MLHRYHRIEVLAALASVLCSWAVTGILVAEAVHRIVNPTPVNGKLMFFLALAGIAINVLNLLILGGHHHHGVGGHDHDHGHSHGEEVHSHGHSHGADGHSHSSGGHSHDHGHKGHDDANINLRGAVIHVLGDFVQSIGVAAAGALIWWKQVMPVCEPHTPALLCRAAVSLSYVVLDPVLRLAVCCYCLNRCCNPHNDID